VVPEEQRNGKPADQDGQLAVSGPGQLVVRDAVGQFHETAPKTAPHGLVETTVLTGCDEILHDCPPREPRNFSTAAATQSGSSSGSRCPPSGWTSSWLPGMSRAKRCPSIEAL